MRRVLLYLLMNVSKLPRFIFGKPIKSRFVARHTAVVDNEIDEAVIRAFVRGSEPAFRKIFDRYAPAIYRVAQRYFHSSALAEELVEELFSTVWRERRLYTDAAQLRLSVFTMARNLALQYLEKTTAEVLSVSHSHQNSSQISPVPKDSRPPG